MERDPTVFKKTVNGLYGPDFIYFFDADHGVCVGDSVGCFEIYMTSNGGANWSQVPRENIPPKLLGEGGITHVFTAAGSSLWFPTMFSGKGRFYRTTDKGLTWSVLVYPNWHLGFYPMIEFQDENVGLCNGGWGDVEKTTDGGVTWMAMPTSMQLAFQDLKYVPRTSGMYVASAFWKTNSLVEHYQYGTLYTLDAGANWTIASASAALNQPADLTLPRLGFAGPTSGWQGDMSQNIYKWTVPTGQIVGVHLDSLVFSAVEAEHRSDTVFVDFVNHGTDPVTLSSIAIRGSDFAVTKQPTLSVNPSSFGSVRVELCFTPPRDGTLRDSIVFVSNASNAPRLAVSLEGRGILIQPAQAGVFYATGTQGGGELYTLSTATGQLTVVGDLGQPEIVSMAIRPTDGKIYGIGPTGNSTQLYKIDPLSGVAVQTATVSIGNLRAIAFSSGDTLFGATTGGSLYRIDPASGHTDSLGTSLRLAFTGLPFRPRNGELWASVRTPTDSIFTLNRNNGAATFVGTTGLNAVTSSIAFDASGSLYGLIDNRTGEDYLATLDTVTASGSIVAGPLSVHYLRAITTISGGFPVSVQDRQLSSTPLKCALSQNYPNPFNPTTKIQLTIANRQLTIVKVYDVLGRDVATLVNEVRQPGTYTVEFDASNLASGMYSYRLQAGDFVSTKRMLVLK